MKKALVATCVVAMTVFGITNASADPVATARANAYGIDIGGSLLDELIEREPEVTSVFPPGGQEIEDIINLDVDPVTVDAAGAVIAETAQESTIVPLLGGEDQAGGTGGDGGDEGLLGGIFEDLLGGDDGGGDGGSLLGDSLLGSNSFQTQQLTGGDDGGDEGLLGGLLGDEELLGGLLNNEEGGDVGDDEIIIPAANARGFARITDLNILIEEEGLDALGLDDTLQTLLLDALLEIDTVNAEAVAVCVGNQVFFDTASNTLSVNDEPVTLLDDLVDTVEDILPEDLLQVERNEVGITADGNGVFVNALRITLLGGDETNVLDETDGGGDGVGGIVDDPTGQVQTQQLTGGDDGDDGGLLGGGGDDEALLDIVLGHAEVSATECAQPVAQTTTTFARTGDAGPSLPRTGGLGALPAVLGVGLLGGALTAGRLALRSRRGN